ncbi:MAG: diguanylate cyclase [Polyangiaceae bacterium]
MNAPGASEPGPTVDGAVLVVDDDEAARLLMCRALRRNKIRCEEAANGEQAIEAVRANPEAFDAVVLDVMMPGIDGFEVVRRLKSSRSTSHIRIIMVTASATTDEEIVRGVEFGAVDYITKPYSPAVLVAKVRAACERSRAESQLRGELLFAEHHAMVDPLTGLFNRRHFVTRMEEASAYAKRHDDPFAVVMLDLDHFKAVNDTYGHQAGDGALVHFATAVREVLRGGEDVAFRYGGEEFVLLLRSCDAVLAVEVAERLRKHLRANPFIFPGDIVRPIAFSAGVAAALESENFANDELVSRADAALYRAKKAGRDRIEPW